MEEIVVTRLWMAGVVAMMLVFGIIAAYGHFRNQTGDDAARNHGQDHQSSEN